MSGKEKVTITAADVGQLSLSALTKTRQIKKGDEFFVVCPDHLPVAKAGKVIAITNAPGKIVGVEFAEAIPGGHTCDKRGKAGHCLWVRPDQLHTAEELKSFADSRAAAAAAKANVAEFDSLEVGGDKGLKFNK